MNIRLKNLSQRLKQEKLDCLLVTSAANISYLVKFKSRDSYLLVSKKKIVYFTDSRYIDEVRPLLKREGISAVNLHGPVFEAIGKECDDLKFRRIGFEGHVMTCLEHRRLAVSLKGKARLFPSGGLVEELRQIKDASEIALMKQALKIAGLTLGFARKIIRPGRKELEIAAELERFMRFHGASNAAFDIIVASGPNSSYPHHAPTNRIIRKNEPVLIDIGAEYKGYKSDLTRVYFLGKISNLTQRVRKVVLQAQQLAIKEIRPGAKMAEIDGVSRGYIVRQGFGKCFGHSLGHGVGLETHEGPRISATSKGFLKPGMVFTVEPGVYLAGKFGIRLEDMVLVTKKGCVVLSGSIN